MLRAYSNWGTQEFLGNIDETSLQDLPDILRQSQHSFLIRSQMSVSQRVFALSRFLTLYKEHRIHIASLISQEIGKAITQSLADVDYDIDYIQRHLDHAQDILASEVVFEDEDSRHTMYYEPKGVAVVISPRNYPTSQRVREIIPVLLAGNTIIYKTSSACMRTAKTLSDLLISCLPSGVIHPVYGGGELGNELTKLEAKLIVFTGSTQVGKKIQDNAAKTLAHTHLELGGSAPGVILPNTCIDDAIMQTILYARWWHAGQICDGLKRLFVHRDQYAELCQKLVLSFSGLRIGNPLDNQTDIGMMISKHARDEVQSFITQSLHQGAKKIELGHYDGTPGPWMSPVLLTDVTLDMPVMTQEVFGPVLPIMVYDTIDEAVQYANTTIYGLGAYVWGDDLAQVEYVSRGLHAGNVSINNTSYLIPQVPFGGYKPASGNFRSHGVIGLRHYTETKTISSPKLLNGF